MLPEELYAYATKIYEDMVETDLSEEAREIYPEYNGEQSLDATDFILTRILRDVGPEYYALGEKEQQLIADFLHDEIHAGLT